MAGKTGNRHDLPEVQRGLTAIAYANGKFRPAARELEADGFKVSPKTLAAWYREHREDYERIRREILPVVGAVVADEHMALARRNNQLEDEIADQLKEKLLDLPPKELSTALRNVAVSSGVHTDKARLLQGDYATPQKPQKTADEIMRELEAEGLKLETIDVEVLDEEIA